MSVPDPISMAVVRSSVVSIAREIFRTFKRTAMLPIIYEVNDRFLQYLRLHFPGDETLVRHASVIDENGERRVKMAALSIVASHRVNGVSQLHTDLMRASVFADFNAIRPRSFVNITNGITPRRWLHHANPALSALISAHIGTEWVTDLRQLEQLVQAAAVASNTARHRRRIDGIRGEFIENCPSSCALRRIPPPGSEGAGLPGVRPVI